MLEFRCTCICVLSSLLLFLQAQAVTLGPTVFDEDVGTAVITVTPDALETPGQQWFLSWATVDGTARNGTDFDGGNGAISSLTPSANLSFNIINNNVEDPDRVFVLNFTIGVNVLDELPQLFDITIVNDDDFTPATLALTDEDGNSLPAEVLPGDQVVACVTLDNLERSGILIINRVIASNGRAGDDHQVTLLYDRGCFPTPGGISSGPSRPPSGGNHKMCFTFDPFVFPHDTLLPDPQLVLVVEGEVGEIPVTHMCGGTGLA